LIVQQCKDKQLNFVSTNLVQRIKSSFGSIESRLGSGQVSGTGRLLLRDVFLDDLHFLLLVVSNSFLFRHFLRLCSDNANKFVGFVVLYRQLLLLRGQLGLQVIDLYTNTFTFNKLFLFNIELKLGVNNRQK
jgi:hypothetical protein